MYFPRYWAKASIDGPGRLGKTVNVLAWGWSDVSTDDALRHATERARALLPRIPPVPGTARQQAYYGDRPFREPILEDLSKGPIKALITRNSLGCEVLNTDCAAFADIDFDPPRLGFFQSLFGGRKKVVEAQTLWEQETLEKLRQVQSGARSLSFRVYRTAGGLRLLIVSRLLPGDNAEAEKWLVAVGSDPLYLRLCHNQKSYRARLTPKPWRCGLKQLKVQFPWATEPEQKRFEKWLASYQSKCTTFAVCDYIETIGLDKPAPELKSIIVLHDERTSVGKGFPLA